MRRLALHVCLGLAGETTPPVGRATVVASEAVLLVLSARKVLEDALWREMQLLLVRCAIAPLSTACGCVLGVVFCTAACSCGRQADSCTRS